MNTPFTFCDSPIEIIPSSRRVPLKFIFGYSDALYAGRDDGYNIPKIPMSFTYIYEIIIPIKIINLIAERRNSRLFNFFQHYLFAIQNFLKLYEKYKDNNTHTHSVCSIL